MTMESQDTSKAAKIVIGVDFGTTFSAVAWASATEQIQQARIVRNWPGCPSNTSEEIDLRCVPSEITYVPAGANSKPLWGFQQAEDSDRFQWFKLGLDAQDRNQTLSKHYFNSWNPPNAPTQVEGLVVDFLKCLRLHVEAQLSTSGPNLSLHYVIGVPTAWPEVALQKTLNCATEAGMPSSRVRLISEPHVAAMHVFETLETHIPPGSAFVLCDAGGGTVDVVSFRFCGRNPHVELQEIGSATGAGWSDAVCNAAVQWWERTGKRKFSGVGEKGVKVPVEGMDDNEFLRIKDGVIHMSDSEIRSLFDPVVDNIVNLVNNQIDKTDCELNAVILVGGFGENQFLYNSLCDRVGIPRIIDILRVPDAWTAVASGALLNGLIDPLPFHSPTSDRVARENYGVKVTIPFTRGNLKHDENKGFWDPYSGTYCVEVINWFLKKGETTSKLSSIQTSPYPVYNAEAPPPEVITRAIFVCDSVEGEGLPLYEDDKSVILLLTLRSKLNIISRTALKPQLGKDEKSYWIMNFAVRCALREDYFEFYMEYDGILDVDSKMMFKNR